MSAKLPGVYTPKEYRERMNQEVREKLGEKTHHAFDTKIPYDINSIPDVNHYTNKFNIMAPTMKHSFENPRGARGVDMGAKPFVPIGGKKRRRKSSTRKRRKSKGRKNTKHYRRKTNRRS